MSSFVYHCTYIPHISPLVAPRTGGKRNPPSTMSFIWGISCMALLFQFCSWVHCPTALPSFHSFKNFAFEPQFVLPNFRHSWLGFGKSAYVFGILRRGLVEFRLSSLYTSYQPPCGSTYRCRTLCTTLQTPTSSRPRVSSRAIQSFPLPSSHSFKGPLPSFHSFKKLAFEPQFVSVLKCTRLLCPYTSYLLPEVHVWSIG